MTGAWGKMIYKINLKQKISWHCPFKDTGDKLFTDVKDNGKKLLPVSLTPVIMPYFGFSSVP